MSRYEPGLHKPVPMGARVRIPPHYVGKVATGTVIGIAALHVVFSYIILLDEPHPTEYGEIRALSIVGSELDSEDGSTNWRLTEEVLLK